MSYKTVLVHVDESARASERIKIAAAVAMAEQAHLIGIAMTGASRYFLQSRLPSETEPNLRDHLALLRDRAMRGLADFETAARRIGMPSFEKRLVDDEAGGGICLQARYADLVVIGQNNPAEHSPVVLPDFPQYVVLHSGRPVLLVPHAGRFDQIGHRVLIGWDGSLAVTHAITGALPLLRRASMVQVAIFHGAQFADVQSAINGDSPAKDITRYLGRHGVQAEVLLHPVPNDIGDALLGLASELQADLIVAGGYGHTRFREIMLGSVTATLLENMSVPVLMSS